MTKLCGFEINYDDKKKNMTVSSMTLLVSLYIAMS